jgi:hypothetical protein
MKAFAICTVGLASVAGIAQADVVTVTATGQVIFNGINDGELGTVNGGEIATMSFTVDSNTFVDGIPGDLRSYAMTPGSFTLSFSGGAGVGLADPYPDGRTPYFTLVDGFPVSDGFFVSDSTTSPGGVDLSQGDFQFNLELGYVGDTLDSLDILDAAGTYEFGGLTRFGMNIWRIAPDNVVMDMDFMQMTITPAPASAALLGLGGLIATRRRR